MSNITAFTNSSDQQTCIRVHACFPNDHVGIRIWTVRLAWTKHLPPCLFFFVCLVINTWQTFGHAPVPTIMVSFSGRNTWESVPVQCTYVDEFWPKQGYFCNKWPKQSQNGQNRATAWQNRAVAPRVNIVAERFRGTHVAKCE